MMGNDSTTLSHTVVVTTRARMQGEKLTLNTHYSFLVMLSRYQYMDDEISYGFPKDPVSTEKDYSAYRDAFFSHLFQEPELILNSHNST